MAVIIFTVFLIRIFYWRSSYRIISIDLFIIFIDLSAMPNKPFNQLLISTFDGIVQAGAIIPTFLHSTNFFST